MIEKWKYLDTSDHDSVALMDLSKAFDCIDNQLLIAKLNAFDGDTNLLYILAMNFEKKK